MPRLVWKELTNPVYLLASGFGAGLSPVAPGTCGTVVGVALYWPLRELSLPVYLGVVAVVCVGGVWICEAAARRLKTQDPQCVVWDEIAGYFVTMALAPRGLVWVAAGFALFRLFDVLKPWPVSWVDRNLKGGLGIMLDDLVAGLYAGASVMLLARLAA